MIDITLLPSEAFECWHCFRIQHLNQQIVVRCCSECQPDVMCLNCFFKKEEKRCYGCKLVTDEQQRQEELKLVINK